MIQIVLYARDVRGRPRRLALEHLTYAVVGLRHIRQLDVGRAVRRPARVLSGASLAWEAGPRSAAELKEAATHYEQSADLGAAPAINAQATRQAALCRSVAEAMEETAAVM